MEDINDKAQLEKLMDRYSNLVYSICFKITNNCFDAQDLTQETFLSVYKNLHSFDGQHEKAWISKIATNKCLDYVKSASKRSLPTESEYFMDVKSDAPTPEESFLLKNSKEHILTLCKSLKPPYDEVASSYFYHEMTVNEIAAASGKKIKTIQTQIYRARDLLKKKLEKGELIIGK